MSNREIAEKYGVGEHVVRKGMKAIEDLAERKVETALSAKNIATEIAALSPAKQRAVNNLADRLMVISEHLAGAASYGAMTAHRLSMIANKQIDRVDDVDPLGADSQEALAGVALLTKMANSSAEIGLNLLRANKEAVDSLNEDDSPPLPRTISVNTVDAA